MDGLRGWAPVVLGLALMGAAGWAQAPEPGTYAIVGARVEIGDGTVLEKGTLLLRDGLIEAVGPEVTVPPEAEVIAGAGLTAYPGFVDALTSQGLSLPAAAPQQDVPPDFGADAPAFMREANRIGIRPELRAAAHLALADAQLIPLRQAGFTTAHVAPSGGIIDGVGAVVNLGGRPRREAVLLDAAGMHAGFRVTRGGGYPGSLLGVFSHFRQALLDAKRYRESQSRFAAQGGRRPPVDETLAALQPVLNRELPVIWDADSPNEIRRAAALAEEFGFRLIIAGGAEAWKVAPWLAQRQIPVLVALNFPAEPRAPGAAAAAGQTPSEEEPEAVRRDRKRLWEERVANAARLREAGVRFAFTTRGTRNPAEFTANLRKAIAAGLPRDAAVQGLTRDAAALLGVDRQVGTLARGKIANVTLLSAAFPEAVGRAKWMFIDGRRFEPEKERAPAAAPAPTAPAPTSGDEHDHPEHSR